MQKVTMDLNIILDFLNKREFHKEAAQILQWSQQGIIEAYVCAHEITTLSYFLEKKLRDREKSGNIIRKLLNLFSVIEINKDILILALDSKISDFEDAVIECSSLKYSINYIITRNLSDFSNSRIKALSPIDFIYKVMEK